MRQRILGIVFCCSVWFAACVPDRAAAQPFALNDPALTADAGQAGYPIRYTLRHFAGQAPGYDTGLTRFELFIPLMEVDGSSLLFCDLQPLIDNDGNWGSNLGLGFRWYSPTFDRVFGAYGYFDYRETDYHRFQQGTFGVDSLGNWIDTRVNVYLPDQDQMALPAEAVEAPHFQGNSLRYGGYQTAMLGGDFEVGVRVPEIAGTQSRLLAGVYHFDGNGETDVTGWKARIETDWTANISTDVALYDDDVFGTTVMVGIALNIQTESFSPWSPHIQSFRRGPMRHITHMAADRIAEPTYRQPNIAVRENTYRATQDGNPLQFIHVVEGATGGNGSFARPFGTLDEAMAVAGPGTIVYTPYGGNYQPIPTFVVPEEVALLSNAPVQWVETDVGWMQIPLSGASPDLSEAPQIWGSVEMSRGSTLNGFWIVGYGDALGETGSVRMVDVADVSVRNNVIWSRQDGIWIEDAMNVTVMDNTVAQALGSGVFLMSGSGVTLAGNTVIQANRDGIEVLSCDSAEIVENVIVEAAGNGISLVQGDHASILGNVIGLAGENGIQVLQGDHANVVGNAIAMAWGDGITLTDAAHAWVADNAIGTAWENGIELVDGPLASIVGNQIGEVAWHGITTTDATGAEIWGNSIQWAGLDGIQVTEGADALIAENHIGEVLGNGITLNYGANATIVRNQIDTAEGYGIELVEGANATVFENDIGQVQRSGISLVRGHNSVIGWNHIAAAGGNGIEIIDAGAIVVGENVIGSAQRNGIAVIRGANATIVYNQVNSVSGSANDPDSGHGIMVQDGTSADISYNQIGSVSGDGIRVADATNATLAGNVIAAAGGRGIAILDGVYVTLLQNEVQHAGEAAFELAGTGNGLTTGNRILSSNGDGIRVTSASSVDISGNELGRIDLNGIVVVDSPAGQIIGNTIEFAGRNGLLLIDGTNLLVADNVIERAVGNGIDIRGGDFAGSLTGNSITEAQTGINAALTGTFQGQISGNTLIDSRAYGISLEAGQFAVGGLVAANVVETSEWEGIAVLATGAGPSTLTVQYNILELNNLEDDTYHHREFVARLAPGAGPFTVELLGNKSYNILTPTEYNFDFLNSSLNALLYSTDAESTNFGAIGSSDGSVPLPP